MSIKFFNLGVFSALFVFAALSPNTLAAPKGKDVPSVSVSRSLLVVKVIGEEATVRRAKGTIKVLATGDRIEVGDKVITGAASTAEVLLGDGSLVRIGPHSEYEFEKFSKNDESPGTFQWAFGLAKGGIRAIVEKNNNPQHAVKFKVNTPAGTMGVRGTELILLHSQETSMSSLYTLSGEVLFDAKGSNFKNPGVQSVKKDMMSTIHNGDASASTPKAFNSEDAIKMLSSKDKKSNSNSNQSLSEVPNLFLPPETQAMRNDNFDIQRVLREVNKASAEFAEAQNYLSGYQRFQNEKVAAVTEGLSLQNKLWTGGGPAKMAQSKAPLTSEEARAAVSQRLQAYAEKLKHEPSIYPVDANKPISDVDYIKLEQQITEAAQQGAVAATCSNREVCKGSGILGLFEKCHTEYICDSAPTKPLSDYPIATSYAAELEKASHDVGSENVQMEGQTSNNEGDHNPVAPPVAAEANDGSPKKDCCKVFIPCPELKAMGEACAKNGHGKPMEVCDKRCKKTIFGNH